MTVRTSPLQDKDLEALLNRLHAMTICIAFSRTRWLRSTTVDAMEYRSYFEFVHDPKNRLRTMTVPFKGGFELTVCV